MYRAMEQIMGKEGKKKESRRMEGVRRSEFEL
jgi:hypothetical protein